MKREPKGPGSGAGFSLVEILIGVLIGLLGTVIIAQVMTRSEAGRRAISGLADSQATGQVALFMLNRDLAQAGQGLAFDYSSFSFVTANPGNPLSASTPMYCTVASALPFNDVPLIPLLIIPSAAGDNPWHIPPGDAGSDMIAVAYGTPGEMVEGLSMDDGRRPVPPLFFTQKTSGLNTAGEIDWVLVVETGLPCTLARATVPTSEQVALDYNPGVAYHKTAVIYNLGPSFSPGHPDPLAGHAPRIAVYAVRNGTLTVCDFLAQGNPDCTAAGSVNDPAVWTPVADGVVALQAQYGWDTSPADPNGSPDGIADVFCKTRLDAGQTCPGTDTPAPANAAPLTPCDVTRIGAVKIALVTRSGQYDRNVVSPDTLKLWQDSAVAPTTKGPTLDVTAIPNVTDPTHYRYRVFQSTVALRSTAGLGGRSRNSAALGAPPFSSVCYN